MVADLLWELSAYMHWADNFTVLFKQITRSKNRWRFTLKDGIMNINQRDYVFHKAHGEAEWWRSTLCKALSAIVIARGPVPIPRHVHWSDKSPACCIRRLRILEFTVHSGRVYYLPTKWCRSIHSKPYAVKDRLVIYITFMHLVMLCNNISSCN